MTYTILDALALGTVLECISYGAYMVLFTLYLVLRHRNHHVVDGPLTLAQILLFGLCTMSFCLDIPAVYFTVVPNVENKDASHELMVGSLVIFAIIDYLAQMILLYRCWIIWDRRWVVVAVPGFLALVTLAGGFTIVGFQCANKEIFTQVYSSIGTTAYAISLSVNALTTLLIVTKIFLTSREVRSVLGSDSHRSLRIVTAVLIESGLFMFAFQLVYVVLFSTQLPASNIFSGALVQIYGITPTLLHIRVVMGSAYDKTTEKTRSLRFAHSQQAVTQTSGPSISALAAGAQSQVADIDLDEVSNEKATDTIV